MKKDTFYFSHDFGARNDPKLQRLIVELGAAALGAYWCLVEQLYEQGGVLPMYVCKSTAFALHVDADMVFCIIKDFDLFEYDDENFWSKSVNKRLSERQQLTESRKKAALSRWKSKDEKNVQCKCNANAMQNDANKIKGKERKDIVIPYSSTITTNPSTPVEESDITMQKEKCKKKSDFVKPSIEEVREYLAQRNSPVDADGFWNFYESKGWMVGKNKMKNWKACVVTWETHEKRQNGNQNKTSSLMAKGIIEPDFGVITTKSR